MKIVKNICIFCFLIFGFVMQAEVFQGELWNFSTAYFMASRYEVSSENLTYFLKDVSQVSSKYHVHVFFYYNEVKTQFRSTLHIYADDEVVCQVIKNVANVEEKEYTSFISGITDVKYQTLQELDETSAGYECFLSYIGEDEAIGSTYQELATKYNLTTPQYWNSTECDMIFIVWGMIILLMIILNVIEVIRRKKEIVVRISFGESVSAIVLKEVINNAIWNVGLFIIAKLFLLRFISGAYENRLVMLLYLIGTMLSILPYYSFYFLNIRKAFANVTQPTVSLYLLYGLKMVACIATIFTISTNFNSIQRNWFADDNLLKSYQNLNYFMIQTEDFNEENENNFWSMLYKKEYERLNPVICIKVLEDKSDVIFVNQNGKKMLQGLEEKLQVVDIGTDDVVIFIPKGKLYEEKKKTALEELDFCFDSSEYDLKQLNIRYLEYSETEYFSYLETSSKDGIERTKNPIIIYQVNNNVKINGSNLEKYKGGAILFQCTDKKLKQISKKYEYLLGVYALIITNVKEQYEYNHAFLVKFLGFLSSLCIIVMMLDISIIVAVSRLEFRKNAMEISLMKILGYSLFERHRTFLRLVTIENSVIFLGMFIFSILSARMSVWICLGVSTFVMLLEFVIAILNIVNIEKVNVQKSLKGGCL